MKNYAKKVWLGGRIYTVDRFFSTATALACSGGRITAVGTDSEIEALIGPDTEVVRLQGAVVLPGLIDSHLHLRMYGESLLKLPLRNKTKAQILMDVKEAVGNLEPGQWLEGGMGWNNEVWEDPSYPTKEELDAVAPDHPVLLPRMDGHLVWVNSKALELCGVNENTPNPSDGEFMKTAGGKLLGCASDAAADCIRSHIPAPDAAARRQAYLAAQKKLLSYGVTSVGDMMVDELAVKDVKSLYEEKLYKLRYYGGLYGVFSPHAAPELRDYFDSCPEVDLYGRHYTVRALKIIADGSFGAQSAAMLEDYSDRPGHKGILMYSDEELTEMVRAAARKKMQVITHAIGDAAIDQILRVYEKVLKEVPAFDHRFRIEHFQIVTGDSRERAKALGVLASMQATHAPNSASMALRRIGAERASRAYAGGLVLETLGMVASGSDAPVAQPDPLDGMHSAVTRTNGELSPAGGFFPQNAFTRKQAIQSYTIWGAYAQFAEHDKGSLEPGKLADFVILDADPMTVEADDLLKIQVVHTIVGGATVYGND